MKRVKLLLGKLGFHAVLLPIFFIIHTYKQYYGLVSTATAVKSLIEIFLYSGLLFILLLAVTKHTNKSFQLTTLLSFILLFFGVIKDFIAFTLHAHLLAKYSILIPILLLITTILIRIILRGKGEGKANLFLTILLLIFIIIDGISLLFSNNSAFLAKNLLVDKQFSTMKLTSDINARPDVYYLVFDCYPGSNFLRKYMQFDNQYFDLALKQKGFYIIQNSKSNYNRTAFSIASTLNFQYLQGIQNNYKVSPKDYNQALLTVNEAEVVKIFKHYKYKFYNLSIFNINGNAPSYKENFLTMPEQSILMYNTLIERIKNDVFWNFTTNKYFNLFVKKILHRKEDNIVTNQVKKRAHNNSILDSLLRISLNNSSFSKFVYAHFFLPHPPYFYDESGKSNDINYITNKKSFRNKTLFLSYLKYTNTVVLKICDQIIKNSGRKAIIILESDHGFTDFEGGPRDPELYFKNYTAFFFPDQNYSMLYDSLSNINTFPILFNKYFKSNILLQKDTSFFLPD